MDVVADHHLQLMNLSAIKSDYLIGRKNIFSLFLNQHDIHKFIVVMILVEKEEITMPKVGKHIYKRKDGRWEGRYVTGYVNGRAKYGSVYAPNCREVREKLDKANRDIALKRTRVIKAGNVSEISDCWIAEASTDLKESSVVKYKNILRCYILPIFGDCELSDITNERFIRFVNDLRTTGGVKKAGLAPSTVSEVVTTMNSLRLYALKRDFTVRFSPECVSVKQDKHDIRIFSITEERKLISYLRKNMELTALGIMICLYTGIRIGELCALKWDEIDLAEKTMKIGRTMQRLHVDGKEHKTEVRILEPKSKHSIRTIPLPDVLVNMLKEKIVPEAFVLTGRTTRFVEPRVMQNRFKKILQKCGIEYANFHATRHTFATRCIELGFDIKSLSEILGHASVTITMNKYVHPTLELKAQNMNRFTGLFEE